MGDLCYRGEAMCTHVVFLTNFYDECMDDNGIELFNIPLAEKGIAHLSIFNYAY